MRTHGSWSARLANAATAGVLVAAAALVARDRALPALRERAVADPGERVPASLRAVDLRRGDTVALGGTGPSALLAVLSTCPACGRSAAAWREALGSAPGRLRLLLIGDPPDAEAAWAARELPGAVPLLPLDRDATLRLLRIRAVPTALTISPDGRLLARREGGVSADEARSLLASIDPASRTPAPLDPRARSDGPGALPSTPARR